MWKFILKNDQEGVFGKSKLLKTITGRPGRIGESSGLFNEAIRSNILNFE